MRRRRRGGREAPPEAVRVDASWLAERLAPAEARFGLRLEAAQWEGLGRYAELLLGWSRRTNLTGAASPEVLADEHLADAFALVSELEGVRRLLDVGSGGGLPGLVLALLRPDLRVVLLEPVTRKHAFLRSAIRVLGLPAEARRERLEAHAPEAAREPYDAAVSRATFPLAEWLERGLPLVRPGGRVLGLEGLEPVALPHDARRIPYHRPGSGRARAVVRRDRPAGGEQG